MFKNRSDLPVINIIPGKMPAVFDSAGTDQTAKFGGENNDSND